MAFNPATLRFRPYPATVHRYTAEEMCGPLPPVLYKVISQPYADRFVREGEMLWSTLSWFQHIEDDDRRDVLEGSLGYFPVTGLSIQRTEHNGQPDNTTIPIPSHGFVPRAAQRDHIYVYSTTLHPCLRLGDVRDRVEIFNPLTFNARLHSAVQQHRRARIATLIHDVVRYWSSEEPPADVWALPDRMTMHKHRDFQDQQEHRFAFGIRADVFDFERIDTALADRLRSESRVSLNPQCHTLKLRLGKFENCCRLL